MNKYKLNKLVLDRLQRKRIILTASSGRCGTMLLAKLLALCPDVDAVHEPSPVIDDVWWRLRERPEQAYRFLVESKLPAILEYPNPTYIETSHQLCKGFFEPLHALGVDFDLIILSRELREVALSMYWLNDIPGRTKTGCRWYPAPGDAENLTTLPKPYHKRFTDYQLCYWYCLEMEARKNHYYELWRSYPRKVVKVTLEELKKKNKFQEFLEALQLPPPAKRTWHEYKLATLTRYNSKGGRKHYLACKGIVKLPIGDLIEQEDEVRRTVYV